MDACYKHISYVNMNIHFLKSFETPRTDTLKKAKHEIGNAKGPNQRKMPMNNKNKYNQN